MQFGLGGGHGGGVALGLGVGQLLVGDHDPDRVEVAVIGSAELHFPFPGSGADRSLRWFGFADGGQVYQEKAPMRFSELRFSAGLGVSWISPVGPLRLSYAVPLNKKPGDRIEGFQFQMGTGF